MQHLDVTIAWSVDGTSFECRGPVAAGLPLGGYVHVTGDEVDRVGQLLHQKIVIEDGRRLVAGGGSLLGTADTEAFDNALVVHRAPSR